VIKVQSRFHCGWNAGSPSHDKQRHLTRIRITAEFLEKTPFLLQDRADHAYLISNRPLSLAPVTSCGTDPILGSEKKMKPHKARRSRKSRHPSVFRRLGQGLEKLEGRRLLAGDIGEALVGPVETDASEAERTVFARIVNGQQTDKFEAVGIVNDGCTGTLIAPNVVLTAGHCVENYDGGFMGDKDGTFEVNGQSYTTTSVVAHHDYDGAAIGSDHANDIAIMVLDQNVAGVEPIEINRTVPYVGQTLTLVGFGGGGTGDAGHNGDFGTKRVGETPIDFVSSTLVSWNFDNNSESNTAPGDSGGPALIDLDGVFYVAGVTSGGDKDDAGIGDHSFDTRVDVYTDWIDAFLSGDPNPNPNPYPDPTPDPDPNPDPGDTNPSGDDHVDQVGDDATLIAIEDGFGFIDAWLETLGDHDAFQFSIDQSETVELDLFSWDGDLDTHLALFDEDGELIAEDAELGDSQIVIELDAGLYYAVAGAVDDQSDGEYGLDIYVGDGLGGDWGEEDWGEEDWGEEDWGEENGDEGDWSEGDWSEEDWDEGDGAEDAIEETELDPSAEADSFEHCDVNSDSTVNAMDVFSILSVILEGEGFSVDATAESQSMDVTGDGRINPQDAMRVINFLVDQSMMLEVGDAEGEAIDTAGEPSNLTQAADARSLPLVTGSVDSLETVAPRSRPVAMVPVNDVDGMMRVESTWADHHVDDELLDLLVS
jgi:V8-like Glu-specific endopeptidase